MTRTYDRIGIQVPEFYLPRHGVDLSRWAVIACDQFTSEPEYWQQVEQVVGDAPSTLKLILPEVSLEKPGEHDLIRRIQANMAEYISQGVLQSQEGTVLIERSVAGKTRRGLLLCLDLEKYDFNKGSQSLIRATEGTILDRLPPRMKIREGARLDLPHEEKEQPDDDEDGEAGHQQLCPDALPFRLGTHYLNPVLEQIIHQLSITNHRNGSGELSVVHPPP